MYKVFAFERLNKMSACEKREIILDEGYVYFQAYHDCLYCYGSVESVRYPDEPIYTVDKGGKFIKAVA